MLLRFACCLLALCLTARAQSQELVAKGMLAKSEDRAGAAAKLAQSVGRKLLAYYVTFGEFDFAVLTDMPSEKEAAAFMYVVGSSAAFENARSTIGMTMAEAKSAFETAARAAATYRSPGGPS